MQISTTKTTTTTTIIKLQATLTDDNGKIFATISGTMDNLHPLGTATLAVSNRTLYEENKGAAVEAYAAFQAAIAAIEAPNDTKTEDVNLLEEG